ncbi:hypothetical protein CISIN_1g038504mg [Citrus sinensis]|uniref:Uncharacterized protein n=1 Tax=Citrus sinensis TaxID=2711 RepID=A0A067ECK8_CITSI|nr:hypothetical protein CISIN_1g038504mg [Citrus sinensis]
MKPIKLKTPPEQIQTITRVMFDIVKKTVLSPLPKLGERVKSGASGLTGKSHMKIVLRWMSERQKLRLVCNHVGPHKQIPYTTWFAKPNNLKQPKSGNDPSPLQP